MKYPAQITSVEFQQSKSLTLKIHPNPTTGLITFVKPMSGLMYVYGMDGKVLVKRYLNEESTVDLSLLDSGVYFLTIANENKFLRSILMI